MTLKMTLYSDKNKTQTLQEVEWEMSPFGLGSWIISNLEQEPSITFREKKWKFWDLCNKFAFDKDGVMNDPSNPDAIIFRKMFLTIVEKCMDQIDDLRRGYFNFNIAEYIKNVQPKWEEMPLDGRRNLIGAEYKEDGTVDIPMEYFADILAGWTLPEYKQWANNLYVLAEYLDKDIHTYLEVSV